MIRKIILATSIVGLAACSQTGKIPILGDLFGYTPPPEELSIAEELKAEYDRCMKIGEEENCAQWAFDIVRKVKGLEPRAVPKGVVIILEGDGNVGTNDDSDQESSEDGSEN
ncbi:hypothetical protein FLL45_07080 [Aliikangiella marina]|uniref:Uncharacterized protein n=1 Tax=Aliikangiella marina TaxID=1712262 RepID=A0A545TBX4_9GAMM|nr:hypothetical protein [Aliikangiella marina]TQV74718.1 hypothetical protein FLL45_07080 [Aliikangiella marina]